MRQALLFFLLNLSLLSFGQTKELTDEDYTNSGATKLIHEIEVSKAKELAKQDIEKGVLILFLQSGISPIIYNTDSIFVNKYKTTYFEQGCMGPDDELMIAYNNEVFKFLDKTHGRKWRKSIRKDVIGYK